MATISDAELLELRHELNDAKAEILRHHFDFERIQKLVDEYDNANVDLLGAFLRELRNIVG